MPGPLLTPVPIADPDSDLDRPTVASPPPDFGLDDPTLRQQLPLDLRTPPPPTLSDFDTDDRATPVDEEPCPSRDTDPGLPPESDGSA